MERRALRAAPVRPRGRPRSRRAHYLRLVITVGQEDQTDHSKHYNRDRLPPRRLRGRRRTNDRGMAHHNRLLLLLVHTQLSRSPRPFSNLRRQTRDTMALHTHTSRHTLQDRLAPTPSRLHQDRQDPSTSPSQFNLMGQTERRSTVPLMDLPSSPLVNVSHRSHSLQACIRHNSRRGTFPIHRRLILPST